MRLNNRSLFQPRARAGYQIENKASDEATVYLYDEVSWWGVNPADFSKDLAAITAPTIHLRVNSPGGAVFDGMAIYNALNGHPAKIIAHVDGLAASIASLIVMAGDEIRIAENARLMIHEPWSIVIGGAQDLRDEAEFLDSMNATIAATYVARTGAAEAQVLEWMAAETWFTAAEAKEAGFVDEVEPLKTGAKALKVFDLSVFPNAPANLKDREPPTERDLERVLRDAGLSRAQAKSVLAEGMKAPLRDAAPPEPDAPETPRDAAPPAPEVPAAPPTKMDPVLALLSKADILLATPPIQKGTAA
jgi:ATP-dependent Clp protease protease subunit